MAHDQKGRGAVCNYAGRFARQTAKPAIDDRAEELNALPKLATMVRNEVAKSIITRNVSPDVPFEQSINPYRGCKHDCIYCFARPTHSYLDLSPGLDFETLLY